MVLMSEPTACQKLWKCYFSSLVNPFELCKAHLLVEAFNMFKNTARTSTSHIKNEALPPQKMYVISTSQIT